MVLTNQVVVVTAYGPTTLAPRERSADWACSVPGIRLSLTPLAASGRWCWHRPAFSRPCNPFENLPDRAQVTSKHLSTYVGVDAFTSEATPVP